MSQKLQRVTTDVITCWLRTGGNCSGMQVADADYCVAIYRLQRKALVRLQCGGRLKRRQRRKGQQLKVFLPRRSAMSSTYEQSELSLTKTTSL